MQGVKGRAHLWHIFGVLRVGSLSLLRRHFDCFLGFCTGRVKSLCARGEKRWYQWRSKEDQRSRIDPPVKGGKEKKRGGERETGREIRDESGLERERVDAGQQHSKNGDDKEIKKEGEESGEASRPNGAKVKLCLAPGQNATIT